MTAASTAPILPPWLVLPVSIGVLLLLAGHLGAMRRAEMPVSRRRIRTINGVVMLCSVPLVAYAFGIATVREGETFVAVWSAVTMLMGVMLVMAMIDTLNNVRLHRKRIRRIRGEALHAMREELLSRAAHGPLRERGYDSGHAGGRDPG